MTKRTQGRPPRDSGVNGREKLIEATRVYLQNNRKMNLTRSEIAQGCGVTPALISYYFKDKRSLLDAVIKPLVRSYAANIRSVSERDGPIEDRMRALIRLMIEINADNAFLVDYMLGAFASDKVDHEDRDVINQVHHALGDLVSALMRAGAWRAADPLLTEVALWGMCRAFGEALRLQPLRSSPQVSRPELLAAEIDYIYGAFAALPFVDAKLRIAASG